MLFKTVAVDFKRWSRAILVGMALLLCANFGLQTAAADTLQETLITAYNSNPRLLAERSRLREIDENYVQAQSQGRLTSNVSGTVGYSVARLPASSFGLTTNTDVVTFDTAPKALQLQAIQPIYQGGRVKALKNQAKSSILASRENLRYIEQTLFFQVANAYSDVRRDEDVANARRNNVRVLARQLGAAEERFDVGVGTRTDTAQAQARLASANIGLAQADAQLQVSRAAFTRLVGIIPRDLQPLPEFIMPQTLEEALSLARGNNPQIIASEFNELAADAAIDLARSANKPSLSLSGTAQSARDQLSNIQTIDTANIGATLTIPITTGGSIRSSVRAAKEARTRAKFETRDIERAVDFNIRQIWAQIDAARRTLDASRLQVEAAEFAFQGVVMEQDVGTRTTLDVLNAEQEVLDAKLSVLNAQSALDVAEMQLLSQMGAFDARALSLPTEIYRPEDNFDAVTGDDSVLIKLKGFAESVVDKAGLD